MKEPPSQLRPSTFHQVRARQSLETYLTAASELLNRASVADLDRISDQVLAKLLAQCERWQVAARGETRKREARNGVRKDLTAGERSQ